MIVWIRGEEETFYKKFPPPLSNAPNKKTPLLSMQLLWINSSIFFASTLLVMYRDYVAKQKALARGI